MGITVGSREVRERMVCDKRQRNANCNNKVDDDSSSSGSSSS